jgi:tRNA A37 threonylcarbamoyltransferase TsaD
LLSQKNLQFFFPKMELCTDNAAMIAACAYFRHTQLGQRDPFDLAPQPGVNLTP